ncbi:AraC family transcriptional regulator [Mycolicibacterium neworleansense]|uniref:AraC family transcriptional regulator n=1 Tax=Mycolicibacterium neworleansense TaxID=146018 RepID=A0A0H5RPT3_9MYCO|nr:helix-turn-helix domain-containing protein [Mycolicibacterium neworleansense]MCV7364998.1 AraC family transcriptional regulator [Mycolicibacterium neworleansense]CRZ15801.1 AraC family transcriptional regulator [Mycolicibacterium neworleansense]
MDVPVVRNRITQLEHLSDAVANAGLSAFQMSREAPSGSLVHASHDGVAFSSGRFDSRVQIRGPLSESALSIAVGLRIPPRNRLLLREIDSGVVTIFRPGDEQEAFHDVNSLYAVVSLSEETLEREAERYGMRLSASSFRRTAIHPQLMARAHLASISSFLTRLHQDGSQTRLHSGAFADIVAAFVGHFTQAPMTLPVRQLRQRQRIVELTRTHIDQNLDRRLDVEGLARLAGVSRRTLARAFDETIGESPQSYIARMRLHRIRSDLLAGTHPRATIADLSNRWGISELGRMSARYRDLFGELPSQTRRRSASNNR